MRTVGSWLLFVLVGYVLGAVITFVTIQIFSGNTHDRSVEAAMSAAFFGGPVLAVLLGLIGSGRARRRRGGDSGRPH
jgi:ABC-type multidrug transport system permease subunit